MRLASITFSINFANFPNEALNGGQVQLPKLRINGTFLVHSSFKLTFDPESRSTRAMLDGTVSPFCTWNDWLYIMSNIPLNIFHPGVILPSSLASLSRFCSFSIFFAFSYKKWKYVARKWPRHIYTKINHFKYIDVWYINLYLPLIFQEKTKS